MIFVITTRVSPEQVDSLPDRSKTPRITSVLWQTILKSEGLCTAIHSPLFIDFYPRISIVVSCESHAVLFNKQINKPP